MGKIFTSLLMLLVAFNFSAAAQISINVTIPDTIYNNYYYSFNLVATGNTAFLSAFPNQRIGLRLIIDDQIAASLYANTDTSANGYIFTDKANVRSGWQDMEIYFTVRNPLGGYYDSLITKPVYVLDSKITSVNTYTDDGLYWFDFTGQNTNFTEGTRLLVIEPVNNPALDRYQGNYSSATQDINPLFPNVGPYVNITQLGDTLGVFYSDTRLAISPHHGFDATAYCNEEMRLIIESTYGRDTIYHTLTDCPEITSITPQNLAFGMNNIRLTGRNTNFSEGTNMVRLSTLASGDVHQDQIEFGYFHAVNDTVCDIEFEYLGSSTANNNCAEDMYIQIEKTYGTFSVPFLTGSPDNCLAFDGCQPNQAYVNSTPTISVTGSNMSFRQGSSLHPYEPNFYLKSTFTPTHFIQPDSVIQLDSLHYDLQFDLNSSNPCGYYELYSEFERDSSSNMGTWPSNDRVVTTYVDSFLLDCGVSLSGKVFYDADSNGIQDPGEPAAKNILLKADPGNLLTMTDAQGQYYFNAVPNTYTVTSTSIGHFSSNPPYQVQLNLGDYVDTLDFGLWLQPDKLDLEIIVTSGAMVNGQDVTYWLNYRNLGLPQTNVEIKAIYDSLQTYVSSIPAAVSVSGRELTWLIDTLGINEMGSIKLTVTNPIIVDVLNAPSMTMSAKILPYAFDLDTVNNTSKVEDQIIGSYDPNDKATMPARGKERNDSTNYTLFEEELEYLIRFQNTGTYYAFDVRVEDTLSSNLDVSTFELIAASHPVEVSLKETGEIAFIFNNIMLPDSNRNEPESHGFVRFKIMPKENLAENDAIENTAHIYFDFNEAVVTNTVENIMVSEIPADISGISDVTSGKGALKVYPNPFSNETTVSFPNPLNEVYTIVVMDISGRVLQQIDDVRSNTATIQRDMLNTGLYLIEVRGPQTYRAKVLVK